MKTQKVRRDLQSDYVDLKPFLKAYQRLESRYHLPTFKNFVRKIMSLKLPCPGMKFKRTHYGFDLSIPLRYVIKTLKLEPRI